jgi:hypothetical protein
MGEGGFPWLLDGLIFLAPVDQILASFNPRIFFKGSSSIHSMAKELECIKWAIIPGAREERKIGPQS